MDYELPQEIKQALDNIETHIMKNFSDFTPDKIMQLLKITARHSYDSAKKEIFGTWEEVQ